MTSPIKSTINVAEAKRRFSEIVNEVVYHKKRFLISRHGKPVIGLVPAEEVKEKTTEPSKNGFLSLVGLWGDMENLDEIIEQIYKERETEIPRPVPSLADDE